MWNFKSLPQKLKVAWSLLWVVVTMPYQVLKLRREVGATIRKGSESWRLDE